LPSARIHGIISKGGEAANVIPDLAITNFYVRAETLEYLKELLNTFDFQEDFINIDSDINEFYNVFNSEINKNEKICRFAYCRFSCRYINCL